MSESIVREFFDLLNALRRTVFPDLFFRGHKSDQPLIINVSDVSAKYVRCRLPDGPCLHLETVEVLSKHGDELVNISKDAGLTASSVFKGMAHLIADRRLLNPNRKSLGIHTNSGGEQWICIQLKNIEPITRIAIYNRDDASAWRAWGLVVDVSVDGNDWIEIYSHSQRKRLFLECIESNLKDKVLTQQERMTATACWEILGDLIKPDMPAAVNRLKGLSELPKAISKQIKRGFNDSVLESFEKQWCGHGITRPFRYWSQNQKTLYLTRATQLANDLNSLSENRCFGFGFVLAYIREGQLIPHDDDLDLIISFNASRASSIASALNLLEAHLNSLGYSVTGSLFNHRWVTKPGWGGAVDVFVGIEEDEDVSWFPGHRRNLRLADVFPPLMVDLYGVSCPVPRNPVRYIEAIYGNDWRCPDPNFTHPWDKSLFADIATNPADNSGWQMESYTDTLSGKLERIDDIRSVDDVAGVGIDFGAETTLK